MTSPAGTPAVATADPRTTAPVRTTADEAIHVEGLGKSYGGREVLRDVSFVVRRGEILALLGPNGAGKTTTVEIIEGYRRPDRGTVAVLGVDPARAGREQRARVGLMLQGGGGIDPRLSAREVVRLFARFHAVPRDPDELLRVVGLTGATARTRYRRLSGGERQRVALALALVGQPEVAILDEPTAGMDVEGRAATRDVLAGLRADGIAVLLTSHDLTDVERVADRIAVLDRGRIVAVDSPAGLVRGSAGLRFRLRRPLDDDERAELTRILHGTLAIDGRPDGGRYRLREAEATPAAVAALAAWCADRGLVVTELSTTGGSLEERYLELIGAETASDAHGDPSGDAGSDVA
ncbi:MAG TPA: ABC transporter ATP-binding protein [Candidatus Limnocylindrales bacterium]|nr:ABC transporter ATP-binding protein [Candidatus Limnocylindrales bacterium]